VGARGGVAAAQLAAGACMSTGHGGGRVSPVSLSPSAVRTNQPAVIGRLPRPVRLLFGWLACVVAGAGDGLSWKHRGFFSRAKKQRRSSTNKCVRCGSR
jgi:hypothetical protein